MSASGPLVGFKVIELAGIGPNPMCAMLLADMGAEVIRVDRVVDAGLGIPVDPKFAVLDRGRRSIAVDLKKPEGVELILKLVEQSDALIEGFRAGVTERLGLGPEDCLARNPKLVYGRVTGWGQDGPLAKAAGHDINYISLAGAAHAIGPADAPPPPPLNLVGDFGGGGAYLAIGVLAALLEAQASGQGQVVDAAMVDGVASLMAAIYGLYAAGVVTDDRGTNILDGGAHYYDAYETADGRYISIASIESKFYDELLELTGFEDPEKKGHRDKTRWPALSEKMAALIKTKTRDEWCELLEGSEICFAPVLTLAEAPRHPHNVARETFVEVDGVVQPAPAPRFSRTPSKIQKGASKHGADTEAVLADCGFDRDQIAAWKGNRVIA
ncbi:MAG TPA: CaiB/BaiF CoA-transferase family protein [Alphaproteobacteria bacterium]|jgi:alpha-methylacyl-CoA racemase|nr:CaiB/BaiF CoA-transferase family protein [Alphaproteobacteria bacterium]